MQGLKHHILRLGNKSANKELVGKEVVCTNTSAERNPSRSRLLETGKRYTIRQISAGNHTALIRLEGLPETTYSEYARLEVPVCFDAGCFEIEKG